MAVRRRSRFVPGVRGDAAFGGRVQFVDVDHGCRGGCGCARRSRSCAPSRFLRVVATGAAAGHAKRRRRGHRYGRRAPDDLCAGWRPRRCSVVRSECGRPERDRHRPTGGRVRHGLPIRHHAASDLEPQFSGRPHRCQSRGGPARHERACDVLQRLEWHGRTRRGCVGVSHGRGGESRVVLGAWELENTTYLAVTSRAGIPLSDVSAVVLNVTLIAPTWGGYLTLYPAGVLRPTSSNLNFARGQTVATSAVVPVGSAGQVAIYDGSADPAQAVVDVAGYYVGGAGPAGSFRPLTPARVLDTRAGNGAPRAAVAPHGTVTVQLAGRGGVPVSNAATATLTVTVTHPTRGGWVSAHPAGGSRPGTSTVNFAAGQTVANAVEVQIGVDGRIQVYNGSSGSIHLVADVSGYYAATSPITWGARRRRSIRGTSSHGFPVRAPTSASLSTTRVKPRPLTAPPGPRPPPPNPGTRCPRSRAPRTRSAWRPTIRAQR